MEHIRNLSHSRFIETYPSRIIPMPNKKALNTLKIPGSVFSVRV